MRQATVLSAVALFFLAQPGHAADAEAKAKEYLKSINGENGAQITVIRNDILGKTFAKHEFVAVIYRQFPVGRPAPEPLKVANVLVVPTGDGKVTPITDTKQLEKFFAENAPKADNKIGDAILDAWLRLSQELAQDGFYRFKEPKAGIGSASSDGKMTLSGSVAVDPAGGNKGEISSTIHFDKGMVVKVDHKVNLSPGPRPRCQATKLLDPDPIVRQMAEDSIRVMGSACKYYLDEQRAKASPDLRKAIDRIWQQILDEGR
jgi:hypothetical protein